MSEANRLNIQQAKPMTDQRLTMPEAAGRLRWSVRYLKSRLAAHNIAPIGRGKAARLTEDDMKALEAKERTCGARTGSTTSLPESDLPSGKSLVATRSAGSSIRRGRGLASELRRGVTFSSESGPVVAFPVPVRR